MLQKGFHKSFTELFALIKRQNEERQKAGPESILWNQTLLENEHEKLNVLNSCLTRAEDAIRKENFVEVYQCQFTLAQYFQGTGDKWLEDHFFRQCLMTSSRVVGDEGKMMAESHCNVGLTLEESGDLAQAADNFELFHQLSKENADWTLGDGEPMHYKACTNLARIYTSIALQCESEGDLLGYLDNLVKAFEMTKGGGDRALEGEASYRLGLAYDKNDDPETALKYLNKYLDICRGLDDNSGIGKACQGIAKAYERQGQVDESIKYLEMYVEVSDNTKDDKAISQACSDLGAMFNSLGRYGQAVEYFNKAYNISRAMNDTEAISSSRVLFGVAAGHKMLTNVTRHVELTTKPCLERLLEWKDNRGDDFEKEIPASSQDDGSPEVTTDKDGEIEAETKEEEVQEEDGGQEEQTVEEKKEPNEQSSD